MAPERDLPRPQAGVCGPRKGYAIAAVAIATLLLAGCQPAVLDPAGPVGTAEKTILLDSVAIMLAIVLPTLAATLVFAWWFRASNRRAQHLPEWSYSGRIELITWSIPLLTILLLGGVAWIGSHQLDPAQPIDPKTKPLDVQVVSLDWKWLFIYPAQGVAAVNQLVLPAGVPVHFSLTSASVMNTFFVPQLGSMIYTMNGMTTQLYLKADHTGVFRGLSGHFSGDGFSDMHFDVTAMTPDNFNAWIATAHASGNTLDAARYAQLAAQSVNARPAIFGNVAPDLFGQIVTQKLPPGPGPQNGAPNPATSARTE